MSRARRIMRRRASPEEEPANPEPDQAPPREPGPDPVDQLKRLHELREQGILTEQEFSAEKKKLLGD